MKRRTGIGRFSVGDDPRSFETDGPAISLALTLGTMSDQDGTWYVRELGNTQAVARVERREGIVRCVRLRACTP